jgi:CubicO group peptidase (beta-lactamase class C family)
MAAPDRDGLIAHILTKILTLVIRRSLVSLVLAAAIAGEGHATHRQASTGDALAAAAKAAAELPRLHSLLVSRRGELVLERYFNGARATRPANIKSASKGVISALVGLAIARGHIKSLDQSIGDYFPELRKDQDARKQAITIEDLLTMRTGLESTSGRNYGAWVQSPNWVRYVLARPVIAERGTKVEYSTGSSHLLSAILTKATRMSTWQFAQEQLAKPLGFTLARWPQDPQGIFFGGNEMVMTPRQMITIGELYANGGRVGERQLLPKSWIDRSFVPRGRSRWGNDREYGYGWWIRELGGRKTYYAWGYGGQFIFVLPSRDLVVVTTSRSDVSRERRDHNDAIYDIVERLIMVAAP